MSEIRCTLCQVRLTGDTDTYGDVHLPMCQWCWLELEFTQVDDTHIIDCATCRNAYDALRHMELEQEEIQ